MTLLFPRILPPRGSRYFYFLEQVKFFSSHFMSSLPLFVGVGPSIRCWRMVSLTSSPYLTHLGTRSQVLEFLSFSSLWLRNFGFQMYILALVCDGKPIAMARPGDPSVIRYSIELLILWPSSLERHVVPTCSSMTYGSQFLVFLLNWIGSRTCGHFGMSSRTPYILPSWQLSVRQNIHTPTFIELNGLYALLVAYK